MSRGVHWHDKLSHVGTTIFTVMSDLARRYGAVNLSQGFPDFDCPEPLKALVGDFMRDGYNQYAPMPGVAALRERIAGQIFSDYGRSVDPESQITITAGATQAIFTALVSFVRPGDEVILIEPAYDCYAPAVALCGGRVVPYRLAAPGFQIDWDEFSQLLTPKTAVIVLNNPHNPTGKIWSAEDMRTLEKIVAPTNILLLSDEVYERLIYDGAAHQSLLGYPALSERGFSVFSFGKTFHATGWKVGYCVGSEAVTAIFRKVHQFNVYSVNTPVQYAIAGYLKNETVLKKLSAFYEKKGIILSVRWALPASAR